jgi:hypothetical protein
MHRDLPEVEFAFRTGRGVGWQHRHASLFKGTERFFSAAYGVGEKVFSTAFARLWRRLLRRIRQGKRPKHLV